MAETDAFDSLLQGWRERIGTVPSPADWVCQRCCGPCGSGYAYCLGCGRVFANAPIPLRSRVVPLTSTLEEGAWYQQLVSYKTTGRSPWPLLGGLVYQYLRAHANAIEELLGGLPTLLTVVPSKRGHQVIDQPLYRMLDEGAGRHDMSWLAPKILLRHTGIAVPRQSYSPNAFSLSDGARADGARIILVEDSWTSGATAISAAGSLLNASASQVVVMPIARLVNAGFWGQTHSYLQAMKAPYDILHWPK